MTPLCSALDKGGKRLLSSHVLHCLRCLQCSFLNENQESAPYEVRLDNIGTSSLAIPCVTWAKCNSCLYSVLVRDIAGTQSALNPGVSSPRQESFLRLCFLREGGNHACAANDLSIEVPSHITDPNNLLYRGALPELIVGKLKTRLTSSVTLEHWVSRLWIQAPRWREIP